MFGYINLIFIKTIIATIIPLKRQTVQKGGGFKGGSAGGNYLFMIIITLKFF